MTFQNWVFNTCTKRETKTEDALAEFFNTLDFDRREEYLVRESFQNSGDAAISQAEPVRVRIRVSGPDRALSPEVAKKYFGGILPHFEACPELKGDWSQLLDAPCEYFSIEDFGTSGLTGNEHAGVHVHGERNAFYHFWRTSARTDKDAGSGKAGSWGVGKFVYIMSSQFRTMFGLTIREHEDPASRGLLFGQAAVKYHTLGETIYSKHGYFGLEPEGDDVILPYRESEALRQFAEDWCLDRRHETGLSVVIPFCRTIDQEALLFSIVKEYGGRILQGKLVVELDLPDSEIVRLEKSNLFRVFETRTTSWEWSEIRALLTLLVDHENAGPQNSVKLPLVKSGKGWGDLTIPEDVLLELTEKFRTHGSVFVTVPVEVERKSGESELSQFEVLLRQEDGSEPIAPVFFRSGLRISGRQMGTKSNGVRSVFISGVGILGELLRLAEGPAHTEWSDSRENLKDRYRYEDRWIKLCRNAPKKLIELARGGSSENDFQSLADLFPDPDYQPDPSPRPQPTRREGRSTTGQPVIEQVGTVPVRLAKTAGGFILRLDNETQATGVRVEMAYARLRGNTFSKWNAADFTASDLSVEVKGGKIIRKARNEIVAEITNSEKFRLTVTGFDEKRDLRVRASEPEES